jgi:hypothetical protein
LACGGASGTASAPRAAEPDWLLMLAGDGRAGVRGLAGLPGGAAIAVGAFDGGLAAGPVVLTSAGARDGFALGVSPAGAATWGVALAGPGDQELTAAAAAADGSVALGGTSAGSAQLGGRAIDVMGEPGAIVARVDGRGAPVWQRAIAATGYAVPVAVAWTGDGDVVVAGYFSGTLDPAGAALHGAGSLDVWVARLAGADGRLLWIHRAGGPAADTARAIAVVGDAVLVGGSFHRWADFSSTTLQSGDAQSDAFVAAVGPGGFLWARSFAADGAGVVQALAPAPGSRVAAAITFDGAIDIGETRVEVDGEGSLGLVALLDAGGKPVWARPVGTADSADALALTGETLAVAGEDTETRAYVAGVSLTGASRWARPVDGPALLSALAGDRSGALLGGTAHGQLKIGRTTSAIAGESDGFVVRLPAR